MAYAPDTVGFTNGDGSILGHFREKSQGHMFEFSANTDPLNNMNEDFPHKVWVTNPIKNIDSGYRYANVRKTVAVIVVDEDEFGLPVIEKWFIKNHKQYELCT
jgi:hypothetical protein|tara:strand:+ start:1174 stop:1482 length:309 start_codon:yes stop_codon:yes gene_type:complete